MYLDLQARSATRDLGLTSAAEWTRENGGAFVEPKDDRIWIWKLFGKINRMGASLTEYRKIDVVFG
jgi:hypothetical protein